MAIQNYRPLTLFDQLQRELPSLFTHPSTETNFDTEEWAPAVDINETDTQFVIHADLPGVKAEDIEVTASDGVLTLKGERNSHKEETQDHYKRVERFSGRFLRRFTLPDNADLDHIAARTKDGVLNLTIPKVAPVEPKRIKIDVE